MSKGKNEAKLDNHHRDKAPSKSGIFEQKRSDTFKVDKWRRSDKAILLDQPFPPLEPEKPKPAKVRKAAAS